MTERMGCVRMMDEVIIRHVWGWNGFGSVFYGLDGGIQGGPSVLREGRGEDNGERGVTMSERGSSKIRRVLTKRKEVKERWGEPRRFKEK